MKKLHATLKRSPQFVTGYCFISDGKNESNSPSPGELERRRRQLEGLEAAGRSLGSPNPGVSHDSGRGGALKDQQVGWLC